MTTPETAYTEIKRLVKSFKDMPAYMDEEIDRQIILFLYVLTKEEEIEIVEG